MIYSVVCYLCSFVLYSVLAEIKYLWQIYDEGEGANCPFLRDFRGVLQFWFIATGAMALASSAGETCQRGVASCGHRQNSRQNVRMTTPTRKALAKVTDCPIIVVNSAGNIECSTNRTRPPRMATMPATTAKITTAAPADGPLPLSDDNLIPP